MPRLHPANTPAAIAAETISPEVRAYYLDATITFGLLMAQAMPAPAAPRFDEQARAAAIAGMWAGRQTVTVKA